MGISKKSTPVSLSRNPIQSSPTVKPSWRNLTRPVCQNHLTSTTVCSVPPNQCLKVCPKTSTKEKLPHVKISRPVLVTSPRSTNTMSTKPERSGVSVQTPTDLTSLLIAPRPYNTLTKSRILSSLDSSGQPRRVCWPKKTCVVSDSTSMTSPCTLMPSIVEVVKSSQPPEECCTLVS